MGEWCETKLGEVNAEETITKTGVVGRRHYITSFCVHAVSFGAAQEMGEDWEWSEPDPEWEGGDEVLYGIGGAPTDIAIEIRDGSTVVWKTNLYTGTLLQGELERSFVFGKDNAVGISAGSDATLYVGATGLGVKARLNLVGYTGGR